MTATYISSDLSAKAMAFGSGLIAVGRSKPLVARIMKLQDAAQAQALVAAGRVNGKVVLEVGWCVYAIMVGCMAFMHQ